LKRDVIAIIANGELLPGGCVREIVREAGIIRATDGGIKLCRMAQIQLDYIIGDMDSSSQSERDFFPAAEIVYRPDQETTDLQKALQFAVTLKPVSIKVIAALGKRADHSTANLLILLAFSHTCPVEIYDNYGRLRILPAGDHVFCPAKGGTVSFFSFGPVSKLSLAGFQYNLTERDYPSYFVGISNVVTADRCEVKFEQGPLFMYEVSQPKPENRFDREVAGNAGTASERG